MPIPSIAGLFTQGPVANPIQNPFAQQQAQDANTTQAMAVTRAKDTALKHLEGILHPRIRRLASNPST